MRRPKRRWRLIDIVAWSAVVQGRVGRKLEESLTEAERESLYAQQAALMQDLKAAAEARLACEGIAVLARRRLGICVTGQLGRLEVASKLRNLVKPLSDTGVVDVVLAASREDKLHFSNGGKEYKGRPSGISALQAATLFGRAASGEVVVDDSPQVARPFVNPSYLKLSDKPQLGEERIWSHVRQWGALVSCYKHFTWLEAKRCATGSATANDLYGSFVKIRDDSLVLKPWDVTDFRNNGSVALPDCLGYSGYNDKVAVVDAGFASAYFTQPLHEYLFNFSGLHVRHGNPEHVLRQTLDKHNVPVVRLDFERAPVVTSRLLDMGTRHDSCVVFDRLKLGKEPKCWPSACKDRTELYCARCPGKVPAGFDDDFFSADPKDPFARPKCPIPDCASHRGRLLGPPEKSVRSQEIDEAVPISARRFTS